MSMAYKTKPSGEEGNQTKRPNTQVAAQEQIDKGRKVVPIPYGTAAPKIKDWQTTDFTAQDFKDNPNIGLKLDQDILDTDCDHPFVCELAPHFLPHTGMKWSRPSKGCISHYGYAIAGAGFFAKFTDINTDGKKDSGTTLIEIRGGRGLQTVIPPSTYINKKGDGITEQLYWEGGVEGIATFLDEEDIEQYKKSVEKIATIALLALHWHGRRHDLCLCVTGLLVRGGVPDDDIIEMLEWVMHLAKDEEAATRLKNDVPGTIQKFRNGDLVTGGKTLSALTSPQVTMKVYKWMRLSPDRDEVVVNLCSFDASDEGNANAVYFLYGPGLHYSSEAKGKWLHHTGTHWVDDAEQEVTRMVRETLRQRREQAEIVGKDVVAKAAKGMAGKIAACMSILRSEPGVAIHITDFDSDKDLLPTRSGIVDLRTGEVLSHSPFFLNTSCIQSEIGTAEDVAPFIDYLNKEISNADAVVPFLRRAFGYSATGHTKEDKLFDLLGSTRSGKGTVLQPILHLFGDPLGGSRSIKTFTDRKNGDTQNFDLAPLRACRFLVVSEGTRTGQLDASKIKTLTGQDLIDCEHKFGQHFQYMPQFKMWLSSNFDINADPDDEALWGRVLAIKFLHSYLGREDTSIREGMFSERVQRGLLWWIIQGAKEWYQVGLNAPDCTHVDAQLQRDANDYMMRWIEDCCEFDPDDPAKPERWASREQVMYSYKSWCETEGITPKQPKSVVLSLTVKGCAYSDATRRYIEDKGSPTGTRRMRGFEGIRVLRGGRTTITIVSGGK